VIGGSIRVVVGDDDELDAELTERAVRTAMPHARIDRCVDGVVCLDALREVLDDPEPRARLAFIDFKMPRMGCIELLEALEETHPRPHDMAIVLFSSGVSPKEVARAMEFGVLEYAIKPTDPRVYEALVCRLCLQAVPAGKNGAEVC
jgi:DNA-binding NarL/FixJ family response regulator